MAKSKTILICFLWLFVCLNLSGQHSSVNCIVKTAESQVGVKEVGNNRGDSVEKYLASTGLGPGYAWCAASINWILEQCKVPTPPKAAWSPSWFPSNRTVWKRTEIEGIRPQPGDVFGIYFSSKSRIAHVGIVKRMTDKHFVTLEGNTNGAGAREGDGYYRKRRPQRAVHKISRWTSVCP